MKKRIITMILVVAVGAAGFLTGYNMNKNKNISEEMAVNIANGVISGMRHNKDSYITYLGETVVEIRDGEDSDYYKVYRGYNDGTLDGGTTVIIDKKTGEVVEWYIDG